MSVTVTQAGGCSIVGVEGRFDARYASWLGEAMARLCQEDPTARIIIDLTGVSMVEPAAVTSLRTAWNETASRVALVSKRLSARRIIRRWGGDRILVFPTVARALEALSSDEAPRPGPVGGFRHQAFLYAGLDEFVEGTASFLGDAMERGEPVLVAVSSAKIAALRDRIGADTPEVRYVDMEHLGHNPARIIPAWRSYAAEQAATGRTFRGVGEPIWAERTSAQLVECQLHESLLNVAFDGGAPWWLLCPYDTSALPLEVVDEAHHTHPFVMQGRSQCRSAHYGDGIRVAAPFDEALPPAPASAVRTRIEPGSCHQVHAVVGAGAKAAGLPADAVQDLVRSVWEVVVAAGVDGGASDLRLWSDDQGMVCEVRHRGHVSDPLAGREQPADEISSARALWVANQLCDLVQVRSIPGDTVVRIHRHRPRR